MELAIRKLPRRLELAAEHLLEAESEVSDARIVGRGDLERAGLAGHERLVLAHRALGFDECAGLILEAYPDHHAVEALVRDVADLALADFVGVLKAAAMALLGMAAMLGGTMRSPSPARSSSWN